MCIPSASRYKYHRLLLAGFFFLVWGITPLFSGADFLPAPGYREQPLLNFETASLPLRLAGQNAHAFLVTALPAPVPDSRQYLALVVPDGQSAVRLDFSPAISLGDYCRQISLWVYGLGELATLSLVIQDSAGDFHSLAPLSLAFQGWRKLSFLIPARVQQKDKFAGQNQPIVLHHFLYSPLKKDAISSENLQIFLLDDISATVRKRYQLHPAR